ncbi:non-ribosomal peptide synthetase [Scytonema sp. NUACC21]
MDNIVDIYELSPTQQGMLFHALYAPESRVYFDQMCFTLHGDLNTTALQQAWQQIVNRHSVMRTGFYWEEMDKPLQVVYASVEVPWVELDWQDLTLEQQQEYFQSFLQADRDQGFALDQAPLMRFALIRYDVETYKVVWSQHHLLIDGWSLPIVFKEFLTFYEAYKQRQQVYLPPPQPYRDYIVWLQQQDLSVCEAFWRNQLRGFTTPTPLIVSKSVSDRADQTQSYGEEDLHLSPSLTVALKTLAQKHHLTLNTIVLGAWALLLNCYTGESDVVFGTTVSGRPPELFGVESVVGLFINTLPVRVQIPATADLIPWLLELQTQQVEQQRYAHSPLVKIQSWSEVPGGIPLFESLVVYENYPVDVTLQEFNSGLEIKDVRSLAVTNYPLTLLAAVSGEELVVKISYDTAYFDNKTICRILGHFETLLQGMVTNPKQHLAALPLLTTTEQQQILVEWNQTHRDYPQNQVLHQLFESQVERTPDAVAVVFEDQQLTYRELSDRAHQLAHYLQELGVEPEVLVGICMERSLEMVVGLLGILFAGGAYVPLETTYPQERLSYMLSDTAVRVLLTHSTSVNALPKHNARVICLDTDWKTIGHRQPNKFPCKVLPQNLAYVIYTSGSTGKPKGVMNTHRGIVNRLLWMQEIYQLKTSDRVLQKTPFSFDVSVWEFFWPLIVGASLIVAKPGGHQDSDYLVSLMTTEQITTVHFVPSMLVALLQDPNLERCYYLKRVICSGEALTIDLQKRFFTRLHCELHNLYGPTEAAIDVTSWECQPTCNDQVVPIGRPIANTQIYLLDSYLRPVPIGVMGELHIGGVGVARGYLNRPDLTLEKFIPNPFGGRRASFNSEPSERLYKTGDLARYLPDGNIEYLGRSDHQVKVRGFRIELGEIELILNQHQKVQQAVVIAREDQPGTKRLVAYIVANEEQPNINDIRSFLNKKLPDYMVPTAFVLLGALPLTPNGKVDRKALLASKVELAKEGEFAPPQTPIEQTLATIWQQVLVLPQISIHDNFFAIGGDSILSIQIVARAKQVGIQITPKQIFQNPTIALLARVSSTQTPIEAQQEIVTGEIPLTPIQRFFFEQNLSEPHYFNQSVLLQVPNDLNPKFLNSAVDRLLEHHDALRLRFVPHAESWQQINSGLEQTGAFETVDLSQVPKSLVLTTLEEIAATKQANLNLAEGPLMRVVLFNLGKACEARLLIIIHHLAVDGVSWRILLEDLNIAYQQLSQGQRIQLPAKTTSFKDWAQKLAEYAQSQTLKSELPYWLGESRSFVSPLPLDFQRGRNTVEAANTVSVSLNEVETRALLQDVPKAYKTQINDVLLTALALVVSRWTHSNCVLFNLEGHGREDIVDGVDLSRTIGWFTTIFPVLLELEAIEKDDIENTLKSVKEQLREIPNKGIGYGLLRYLCLEQEIASQLKALPQAQISFNYLGQFTQVLNTSSWMQLASDSAGYNQSLHGDRAHLLDINSIIIEERLQISWTYSTNVHQHTTIENLAQEFVATLREIIAHCSSGENGGYTPSDFPLVKFSQQELDQLLTRSAFKQESSKTNWRNVEDIYPLSPMQQGMLFESLYAPASGVYFEQLSCTLTGNLNVRVFEQAWQYLVAQHSILRTAFVWELVRQPLQIVYREVNLTVDTYDWQELSVEQQQQKLKLFLDSDRQQGFQLSQAPLMRLSLIQLDRNSYQFVWSHHHLLLDGWSLPLVFKDLLNFYQVFSQGQSLPLQPARSYRNYIAWLQQQDRELAQEFWQQKLKGFSVPTPLTVDKLLPNQENGKVSYDEQQIQLTVQTTAAVGSFSRQHQLTINNLMQASWALLLCRYTQETDVIFGATVSGRPPALVDVESMVGLFINTLPVRVQISDETELLDLLKNLQMQQVESEQFSYSPLVEIQGLSEVPRGIPLFESLVVFENYPVDAVVQQHNSSFSISNLRRIEQTHYPLIVVVVPGEQLLVKVSYDTSRFDDGTISRMLGHFVTMLSAIVANPQQPISQLPLLTASEQQQLLLEWNNTQVGYPQDKCIYQLFEAQVERTPDAVAVVFENQQLTYGELNCRANQLAHYLHSLGVGADGLVGICVERSLEMLVGILGILKAGGAYVPLDPEYPQERLSFILEDAQVSVLLTQQELVESIPKHQASVVCLDTDWEKIAQQCESNFLNGATPSNLAYVIYTSGSTGKPKGVLVNHYNVVRLFEATNSWYHFNSQEVWTLFHSYAFDFSVWEIWGALLYGGRLVVVSYPIARSPESFHQLLCQEKVTILNQTPSAFRQLIQAEQSIATVGHLNLRLIIFGGEALEFKSLQPWFERHGDRSPLLVNMYGITETTVHVSYRPLSKDDLNGTASVIGRPIPDLQVYVLDRHLQPVPIGVPGEMYVGGAGVTRGYLNRPELTAQRFISNPFKEVKGSKLLYKTGDLARYLPNGELEYLGRIDNQVKIRGFRIELGEIEGLLVQHPAIWESVVVVREDKLGNKRLVGYIVPKTEQSPTVAELRRFLTQKLPNYMVPSAFVQLEALPLTANGKIDRLALPSPDTGRPELENVFVAPSTREEKILAAIWANVLDIEQVGINDNFFALGGDSIRSIQVLSQAKEQGLSFSVQQLFKHQTIHELVQELKIQENDTTKLELIQPFSLISQADKHLLPDGIEDAYPLAMLQMGMIYHSEYSQDSAIYHDIFSYYLKTPLDIQLLQVAVQDLINHHAILRTSFELVNFSIPLQLVHQQVELLLQVEDWCHLNDSEQEEALAAWFEAEKKRHFDWTHLPLVRFFVHRRTREAFNLTVSCHHVILDGWSVASMMTELLKRYSSLWRKAVDYVLPQFSVAYRDFIALEQQALASSETQRYWSEQLNGSTFTRLPRWSWLSKNANVREHGMQEVTLSPEIFAGLKQLAQTAEVPLKSVLLAAHLRVLNFLSGEEDVLTGLVANGRPEQNDGERVLGLFLNTLPFRLQLTGGTWTDLVQQVFAAEREMLPHRRYPLAQIQKSLGGEPLFETAFNFTHFHVYEQVLQLDNLQVLDGKFFQKTNFTFIAQFSVNLMSSEIELNLNYNPYELCSEQINRIGDYYHSVLAAMANQSQGRYELHSVISLQERHQLLVEWNQTAVEYPYDKCLHQLFEEQVERTPDAVAVVFENEQLTYHQLNCRANQLAHYLKSLGVKAEVLVGICVERSLEMVVGLLGILKAGGAYIPLDPSYPCDRLNYILNESQLSVLLTQSRLLNLLPEHKAQLVCLDIDWQVIAANSGENLTCRANGDNLAYVIYTSGSTGKPKGVMNTHRGICNRLLWMLGAYQLTATDHVLQKTTFSFDVSIWEFFCPIITGARLVIAQPGGHQDSRYLVNLIAQQKITTVHFVPSMLQVFLLEQGLEDCSCLRRVFCSGEALLFELQESFFARLKCELHNLYGPTEAAIEVTSWQCQPQSNITIVPIGRPIANTQIYLLDAHLRPVPIGVRGELHIGGIGVARGYLNRPDLTEEKFIPNPFRGSGEASFNSERLYKTGDLARYLPDGNIEYLGRIDHQVKVRGFRIELGEIEIVLTQHQKVQQAAVIAREDQPGTKRLVAYLVPKEEPLSTKELQNFLKEKLPDYMVPSTFVVRENLPLTPNGKVDRKALQTQELELTYSVEYILPRTSTEKKLASIWAEVLKLEKVGIYDNFFELGGDSILSIQIVARANQAGLQLSPKQMFQYQTIAELASVAGTAYLAQAEQGLVMGTVPLTPIQHWFSELHLCEPHHFNQSLLLEVSSQLQPEILEQALVQLLQHHDALRLQFKSSATGWEQAIVSPENITIPLLTVVDLSELLPEQQELALETKAAEFQASFDFNAIPLMRVVLFKLGTNQSERLLIIVHHLVIDGVSWRILLEDMVKAYQQLSRAEAVQLPPKTNSFKEWSERLRDYGESEALVAELDYWLRLSRAQVVRLPVDCVNEREVNTVATTAQVSITLSVAQTQALLQEVPKVYNSQINDVLLTALMQSFQAWTGEKVLLVDLEGHGREEVFEGVDLSRTVGWFTSLFPVLLELEVQHPSEALKSIKEQLRRLPQRGIGYGILRYLNHDKRVQTLMQALPQAEVSFNYLGQFDRVFSGENFVLGIAKEATGSENSFHNRRCYLLEVNAWVVSGQLQINWIYSEALHQRLTIEELAHRYKAALEELIVYSQSPDAGSYTPSDFPDVDLTQETLDQILADIYQANTED